MLHGLFIGSLASWYFTVAPALARGHRVLLYDLRGHGRSERTRSGYDLATQAADLDALTASIPEPLALVGHSYGGLVALRFALDRPERVRKLAIVEAPLPPSRFEELGAMLHGDVAALVGALPEALRQVALGQGRRAQRLFSSLHALAAETSLLADLRAEKDIPDAELSRLGVPALCVYGERSSCRPVGERLARVLPRVRLQVLPGGHYLPFESSAPLGAALAEFLDG
jgi:pimeloyl-ACP methyl ester carboxylesterase